MNLSIIADATQEPVSIAEAKAQLRLEPSFTDDDGQLALLITAARLEAEIASHRVLARKQYLLTFDAFPTNYANFRVQYPVGAAGIDPILFQFAASPDSIELLDPLISVDSMTYQDGAGTVTTMAAGTDYIVDLIKHPGIICPASGKTWPTPVKGYWPTSAVQVEFTAGFSPATVPAKYKQGILLLVSQWYANRIPFEAIRFVAELPFSVTCLLMSDRLERF